MPADHEAEAREIAGVQVAAPTRAPLRVLFACAATFTVLTAIATYLDTPGRPGSGASSPLGLLSVLALLVATRAFIALLVTLTREHRLRWGHVLVTAVLFYVSLALLFAPFYAVAGPGSLTLEAGPRRLALALVYALLAAILAPRRRDRPWRGRPS